MKLSTKNNFNFIRLLAATMVLFSHQHALSGISENPVLGNSLGGLGVQIFFTISGYLIYQSWSSDPAIGRFLLKRFLRIWPGLTAMVLLTILVIGPLVTDISIHEYFSSSDTWRYARALKVFALGGPLPGVFDGLPQNRVVNASLWTLPVEVRWYLITGAIGTAGLLKRRLTLPSIFIILSIYANTQIPTGTREDTIALGQYFLIGAILRQERSIWLIRPHLLPTLFIFSALAYLAGIAPTITSSFFVSFLSIWLGQASTPALRDFGKFGDISYGTYIYAFPIQQSVIQFGVLARGWSFGEGLAMAMVITYLAAFFSWHTIEKQALKLKPVKISLAGAG